MKRLNTRKVKKRREGEEVGENAGGEEERCREKETAREGKRRMKG